MVDVAEGFSDELKDWEDVGFQAPRPVGRPPASISLALVERAASIGCTDDEIAAVLGIHRDTFYARKANEPEIGEVIQRGRAGGKSTLRRLQWHGAKAGNPTMLIWLGKQMLGQRDNVEVTGPDGGAIKIEDVTTPLDAARRIAFALAAAAAIPTQET